MERVNTIEAKRPWRARGGVCTALTLASSVLALGAITQAGSETAVAHGPDFYAWGYNGTGSFGENLNANEVKSPIPVALPDGLAPISISTNGDYSLAIASDGTLYSWGDGTDGRLGDGSTTSSVTPVLVDLPKGITAVAVSAGLDSAMAIGSDGSVYAWGGNGSGQLGQGYTGASPSDPKGPTYSSTPLKVENTDGVTFTSISTNGYTMAEVSSAGVLSMWGSNDDGQLGNGGTTDSNLPAPVDVLLGSTPQTIASISVGGSGNVEAATTAGSVYSWGDDAQGQLGNYTGQWDGYPQGVQPILTPTPLPMPSGVGSVTAVSAGTYNGYALTTTGNIVAWGADAYGGLGNGIVPTESFYTSEPVIVDSPTSGGTYTQVSAGSVSVVALTSTGAVDSWGQDADGNYGNDTATSATGYVPVAASMPAGVTPWSVDSGGTVTYVLSDAGPPVFTSGDTTTMTAQTTSRFKVITSGAPAASLIESGTLPSGVSFTDNGDGTGTLSGAPATGTEGSYPLTFYASNSFEDGVPQSFTLTVDGPPAFTSPALAAFAPGAAGSFTITTSGTPSASVALSTGTLPTGLKFTPGPGGTATISGMPSGEVRSTTLTLLATNGFAPNATQRLKISIQHPPTFTSPTTATFVVGTKGSFGITTTGSPSATVATATPLPTGLSLVDGPHGTARLSGTPGIGTGGIHKITLTASNPLTASEHLSVTINERPSFESPVPFHFTIGRNGNAFVTFSTGYPSAVTITCTGLPRGLTFTNRGGGFGSINGDPSGPARTISITLTAKNKTGSTSVKVPLVITKGGGTT